MRSEEEIKEQIKGLKKDRDKYIKKVYGLNDKETSDIYLSNVDKLQGMLISLEWVLDSDNGGDDSDE